MFVDQVAHVRRSTLKKSVKVKAIGVYSISMIFGKINTVYTKDH